MEYYAIYKPYGMLSQFTKELPGQITLADLNFHFPKDVYPVGRLDADSEGLLLLTNDKAAVKKLLEPSNHVAKTYLVQVEGIPTAEAVEQLQKGVAIRVKKKLLTTRPAMVRRLSEPPQLPPRNPPVRFRRNIPDCWLEITLTEGKNRQVRKMCAAVGHPVLRLVRIAFGKWKLNDLAPGEVVKL